MKNQERGAEHATGFAPTIHLLRWSLVIPAAVAAWFLTLGVCMFVDANVQGLLCTQNEIDELSCRVWPSMEMIFAFAGLSALCVEAIAFWVAPDRKLAVVWITWLIGSAIASSIAGNPLNGPGAVAVLSGLFGALAATYYLRVVEKKRGVDQV